MDAVVNALVGAIANENTEEEGGGWGPSAEGEAKAGPKGECDGQGERERSDHYGEIGRAGVVAEMGAPAVFAHREPRLVGEAMDNIFEQGPEEEPAG